MNVKLFIILITTLCFLPLSQAANKTTIATCEKNGKSMVEISQCLDKVINTVDRELQTWINNQIFILEEFESTTGRKSALSMFKRAQRNFITYRENNCRWQYLALSPGTGAGPAYKKCYILLSKSRIKELSNIN